MDKIQYFLIFFCITVLGLYITHNTRTLEVVLIASTALGAAYHGIKNLGLKKTFSYFLIAFLVGLTAEILGSNYGAFFKSTYTYKNQLIMVYGVPIEIPIFWFVFSYAAFCTTNVLFIAKQKSNPLMLSLVDGTMLVLLDLVLDPYMVSKGYWVWERHGIYFGIPIENFFGWFIVGGLINYIFRRFIEQDPHVKNNVAGYISYILFLISISVASMIKGLFYTGLLGFLVSLLFVTLQLTKKV